MTFSASVPKSSIVFLTESNQFKRKYSSAYRALRDYYCKRDAKEDDRIALRRKERRAIIKYLLSLHTKDSKINLYGLDTTNHYRVYASKGVDRKNVRSKNNRLSEAGYEYSVLCNLKENHWSIPVSIERVGSSDNKYTVGVSQILDAHCAGEQDSITIGVGDAAYSNCGYIEPLYHKDNLVSITRDRKNRVVHRMFTGKQKASGRKRFYGERVYLTGKNINIYPDNETEFSDIIQRGKHAKVILKEYKMLLIKGRKFHSMKDKPVNYVKAEVYAIDGNRMYKHDLLICVSGKHRDLISAKSVYEYYKSRFDIEHFFKFAKSKLRFDKLQTTNPDIDEDYCLFTAIAYNHIYHLKDYVQTVKDYDWYKSKNKNKTPSIVYRSISELKDSFYDITSPPKIRGIPDERNIRKSFTKKGKAPVIIKSTKSDKVEICIKVPFGKTKKFVQTAFNANKLDKQTLIAKISDLHKKIMPIPEPNMTQLR